MIKNLLPFIIFCITLCSCNFNNKQSADLLVYNAEVYTVDENFTVVTAFVVKNGKFLETGTTEDLEEKYEVTKRINAGGKTIVPGLIDAHAHFYRLGLQQQKVDLIGTKSFEEVVSRIVEFQNNRNLDFITGRGWDQNDWEIKEFPNKDTLDKLFPNTPVAITRIDEHALLANKAALDKAGITVSTPAQGGAIEVKDGKLTGILIDNPMKMVTGVDEPPTREEQIQALQDAEKICFSFGLTTVVDAGVDRATVELIEGLHEKNQLKIRIYAMLSNTSDNLDHYLDKDPIKTNRLHVRSVKYYGDGALGSRGAVLKEPYFDDPGHYGAMRSSIEEFKDLAARVAQSKFQLNSHAIGDSANVVVLQTYNELLKDGEDRRWRVEHAQIIGEGDFSYFNKNIIPSIQPTHATSDMYWAEDRLGAKRIQGAYAFKRLLDQAGIVALGTDFPVEDVNPFYTFYAATARKDLNNYPEGGYMPNQALSREETLRGMTIWAAYSNFEEKEKGSIEAGKLADFIILDRNLMTVPEEEVPLIQVLQTWLNGEMVFEKN